MLPKEHRLRRTRDFARVRRFGRSTGGSLLALYALPNRSQATRVGISVSKRVGKATIRNRVKRRVREAVRSRLPDIRSGLDLVFVARQPAAEATYAEIAAAVSAALRRTNVIRSVERSHHA
jgi:ribonuclease P protein component